MIDDTNRIIPRKKVNWISGLSMILPLAAFYTCITYLGDEPLWFLLLGVIGFFGERAINKRIWRIRWQELATQTNLKLKPVGRGLNFKRFELSGRYRDLDTTLDLFTAGRKSYKKNYTRFTIILPFDTSEDFTIKPNSLLHYNREVIGDEEFDKKFTVMEGNLQSIRRILQNHRVRQGLLELHSSATSVELHPLSASMKLSLGGNKLEFYQSGIVKDTAYLHALLDYLHIFADALKRLDPDSIF